MLGAREKLTVKRFINGSADGNLGGFVDSERNIIIDVSQRWEVKPTCAAKKKHPTQGRLATFWELLICSIKIQL